MAQNDAMIQIAVRIPKQLKKELTEAGEKHYRSFNGELIFAIETYLKDWQNKH